MDKIYIKTYNGEYWKKVRREAWSSAMEKSGMKILIPFLIVLFGAIALTGIPLVIGWVEYPFFRDNFFANALTGLSQILISIVSLVGFFFLLLYQIPPKKDMGLRSEIEKEERDLNAFKERLSNKKIKIVNLNSKLVMNDINVELRPIINNDSSYSMTNYFALIEKVKYAKDNDEKPTETNFPNNTLHLIWPGVPPMAYRTDPIPPGDNAQLAIAATINNLNAFKFTTKESDRFNKFDEAGYYIATIKIGGMFDGVGVVKRIDIAVKYDGEKSLDVSTYWDLPEEE